MAQIEFNMAKMMTQFLTWMTEVCHLGNSNQGSNDQGTKHSQNNYAQQFRSKKQAK
jgi:hypothetical protein